MRHPRLGLGILAGAALALSAVPADAHAQAHIVLSQGEARSRLASAPAPTYPMIAAAAKVTGAVNVMVTIGIDGVVSSAESVRGPLMLQGAAARAVATWRFRPSTGPNGEPVLVSSMMTVLFGPPPSPSDLQTLIEYGDAAVRCTILVDAGQLEQSLIPCEEAMRQAAVVAPRFGPDVHVPLAYSLALVAAGQEDQSLASLASAERAYPRNRTGIGRSSPSDTSCGHACTGPAPD